MKKSNFIQVILFSGFISVFFLLNLFHRDNKFSELENRYLAQMPKFTLSALFNGIYTSKFEAYTSDQFFGRDSWVSLKSYSERAVGKQENNGVYFAGNDTLIKRFEKPDETRLQSNINAVNKLVENAGSIPVYLSIAPEAVRILEDKLPAGAPNYDQKTLIDQIYANVNANCVDAFSNLYEHRDEYIYYRTDHHWTTLGAYYGYQALMVSMGLEAVPLSSFTPLQMTDSFYGTVFSSSGVRWVPPDSIDVYVTNYAADIVNYPNGEATEGKLYDWSFLEQKDKYSMFLGGNTPLIEITTKNSDGPALLILRDSNMDSMIPFLLEHFSKIYVVDLRYNLTPVSQYLHENSVDMILVAYNVSNFTTDPNLLLAQY